MSRREAEQFEKALQRASRGQEVESHLAPLVETARQIASLAEPPPPPPHRLAPGRQRLLVEAARLRAAKATERKRRWTTSAMKLTATLAVMLVLFGMIVGVEQATADSLPGDPLYGLKLAVEETRLALTADPQAKAELSLTLASERLDEVTELAARGQAIDEAMVRRVEQHLAAALAAAAQAGGDLADQARQRLTAAIQQRQRMMEDVTSGSPEPPVRDLLREMERMRQELHTGQGEPEGSQERMRHGTPGLEQTPTPHPTRTPGPEQTPTPHPTRTPGPEQTYTPHPTRTPGPEQTYIPHPTRTPGPEQTRTPHPTHTPGPGPDHPSPPPLWPGRGDSDGGNNNP